MSVADFVEATTQADSTDEIRRLLTDAVERLGFAYTAFSDVSRYQETGDLDCLAVVLTFPEEWTDHYVRQGYADIDPVHHFARHSPRAFTWDQVRAQKGLLPRQQTILEECRIAGLPHGVTVPLFGPRGSTALLSVAGAGRELEDPGKLRLVSTLAAQFYIAHQALLENEPEVPDFVPLTGREREVLTWSARGKSNWAISEILHISERSVNFHITNAMRKLQASTRIMAVLKAIRHGLIQV